MKKTLLSITLLLFFYIASSQVRISGYVIDVFSKLPLEKAIVTLNGSDNTLLTDENGYFTVVLKRAGVYEFEVSKNGYKSLAEELMLNKSIEIQIALTSNAGTSEPIYATKTQKKKTSFLQEDEFDRKEKKRLKELEDARKAKERKAAKEKLDAERKIIAEKLAQEKIQAEKDEAARILKKEREYAKLLEIERLNKLEAERKAKAIQVEKERKALEKQRIADEKARQLLLANQEKEAKRLKQERLLAEKQAETNRLAKDKKLAEQKRKENAPEVKKVYKKKSNIKYTLSGIILDKFTKEPLNKAVISFEGIKKTYTTTSTGKFKIIISEGDYYMNVKMKGYQTESAQLPVTEDLEISIMLSKESEKIIETDEVLIIATRATSKTPTTFSKIKREELLENSLGKDLPYLLELTPSVVASSDGGNGVGYTSMRIRGSDMSRINFTLNGFPVNDAESQGVFLVDLPDLASDIQDIQIQRGIGTSTNGAGAFGASVNINTHKKHSKAYAEIDNSLGSFNTIKNSIKAGTGLLYDHFTFDGRFSHLATDGFIDRSNAKMYAFSFDAAYYNKKSVVRFNVFSGREVTHQAWNGVDYSTMKNDRTFNSAGTDYGQKEEAHENEIDKYDQDNYQLSFSHQFSSKISAKIGFHYTKGKGYFEQYKVDEDLLEYGIISASSNTDLIRRRWLNNIFFGSIFSINYKAKNLTTTLGGGWNQYDGDHYGEIVWAKNATDINSNEYYYLNNGLKTDFNTYLKAEYIVFKRVVLFGDIQYRNIGYTIQGNDNDQKQIFRDVDYHFFNPKFGATVLFGKQKNSQIYASFAMASREPTRNDFIDNDIVPKPENMMDFELGFRQKSKKMNIGANAFYMKYKDQLVLTGELNDVGTAIRTNVDNSFRTGLELDLAYEPLKFFGLNATATYSINEINELSITDNIGNTETHDKTKISYSPQFITSLVLYTKAFKGFKFALINKYVSEQYLDNTSSKNKVLTPYFLTDAKVSYSVKPKFMNEIQLILKVNNLFNTEYSANGYVYYDTPYFYPQAGTNFEGGINLKF